MRHECAFYGITSFEDYSGTATQQAEARQIEENNGLFQHDPYLKNYLPSDLRLANNDSVGPYCNIDGIITKDFTQGRCVEYVSPFANERYRIRTSKDAGVYVFSYKKNTLILYASFSQNPQPWHGGPNIYSKVIYQSDGATQFAQAHGSQSDTEVASTPTKPSQTGSSTQTAIVDCTQGTLFDKAQCMAKNTAIGAILNR